MSTIPSLRREAGLLGGVRRARPMWLLAAAAACLAGMEGSFAWLSLLVQDDLASGFTLPARHLFDYVVFGLTGFVAALVALAWGSDFAAEAKDCFRFDARARAWFAAHAIFAVGLVGLYFAAPTLAPRLTSEGLFATNLLVGAAALVCLALSIAAPPAWIALLVRLRAAIGIAAGTGLAVSLLSLAAQAAWPALSALTTGYANALLSLFYDGVVYDPGTTRIGLGNFSVYIANVCSGMEGIALICTFCLGYLILFRRILRFPAALLIVPLGALVMWLLNGVRIAALVWIGAEISPDAAVLGFHSHAGWLMFSIASVGLIVLTHSTRLFSIAAPRHAGGQVGIDTDARLVTAELAPLGVLMFLTLLAQTFSLGDLWSSAAKAIVLAAVLWAFRANYRALLSAPTLRALATGLVIGVIWFFSTPASAASQAAPFEPGAFPLWFAVKAIAFVVIVPIAEELAFRGYLKRKIEAGRGSALLLSLSLIVTSVLFGLLHERWLAGTLAGGLFWLLTYDRGRVSDAIAAHAAANATILAAAILTQTWTAL